MSSSSCTFFTGKSSTSSSEHKESVAVAGIENGQMFWLICPPVLCPRPHPHPHMHSTSLCSCITWHSLDKPNWRERICRLWSLEEGSSSESWLSSQEALFLTALCKHWKRDAKKMSQTHYFHCKHLLYCPVFRSSGAACGFYACVRVSADPGFGKLFHFLQV